MEPGERWARGVHPAGNAGEESDTETRGRGDTGTGDPSPPRVSASGVVAASFPPRPASVVTVVAWREPMPTLRCTVCLRRWRAGGPYACDCPPVLEIPMPPTPCPICARHGPHSPDCPCLDDDTASANDPRIALIAVRLPPLWEHVPLALVAWLLCGAVGLVLWLGLRGLLRLVGVWP
jgi:hypothetical protein